VPIETVPEHDIRYHLIAFDAKGRERPEEGGPYSPAVLREAATSEPTDVFLFSHGWQGDVPAARRQYGRWLAAMAFCPNDLAAVAAMPGGFRPLLIGLHWPSKAWGDEQLGGASFLIEATGEALDGDDTKDDVESLVNRLAAQLNDSLATRQAIRTIVESALVDAVPGTLPTEVRKAYEVIDAEAGMGQEGAGAAPGDDREPFDAEATYQACQQEEIVSFGEVSRGGVLAPLRVLTYWQMKRRARDFGESGASALLRALQAAAPTARFHLMGHSFGCIVASAAIAGPSAPTTIQRPVDTLVLVQGAMSLWSFCSAIPARSDRPGYFHPVVAGEMVDGPVLVTTSVHDRAVRVFYPMGASARRQVDYDAPDVLPTYGGIGTYGMRGPGLEIVDERMHALGEAYELRPRVVHNLDADEVIASSEGIMGAHSDICHPAVAHAVWQAVVATSG
jgi:pimeloyl-ACP methyl ester carboxylesterase